MRTAILVACFAAAGCDTPCASAPTPAPLTVTSVLAFPLTTPTVTACIDSYCDVLSVSAPTTSPIALPHADATLEIAPTTGGTLITLHFAPADATTDAGGTHLAGHARDGSAIYLLVYEPSFGRNVLERAAPVPPDASCAVWTMRL